MTAKEFRRLALSLPQVTENAQWRASGLPGSGSDFRLSGLPGARMGYDQAHVRPARLAPTEPTRQLHASAGRGAAPEVPMCGSARPVGPWFAGLLPDMLRYDPRQVA